MGGGQMEHNRDNYVAYLLRLWRVNANGRWVWRASLEHPQTRTRQGFGDLGELFEFLETQCRCEGVAKSQVGTANSVARSEGSRWVQRC